MILQKIEIALPGRLTPNGNRTWLEKNFAPLAREKTASEARWLRANLAAMDPDRHGLRWLDVGCGLGCARNVVRGGYTGIDPVADAVRRAAARFPEDTFAVGEAVTLPFEDGSFDRVLLVNVAQMLDKDELAASLREIFRVLRRGGMAFALWQSFQDSGWMHVPGVEEPWWFTLHEEAEFGRAAEASGLKTVSSCDYGDCCAAVFQKA